METEGTESKIMDVRRAAMKSSAAAYGVSLAAVAVAVAARLLLEPLLADHLPFITLFLAVGFAAWYGGRGPGLLALVAGALAAGFFLTQPRYSFAIYQTEYEVGLVLYAVVGFASIAMFESLRKAQRQVEEQRQQLEQELAARRLTEQAFAEQAERLRTTLASIGDAVITTDLAGCITNMNAVAESLTGWTTAEAMGQLLDAVFRIVNETTRKTVENPAFRALKEGVIVGLANHTVLIAKDGTERPIDDSAAPIRCKDGEVVGCVLVFRDISERHRQEEALHESQEFTRSVLFNVFSFVGVMTVDGTLTDANRSSLEAAGIPASEVLGKKFWDCYWWSYSTEIQAQLRDACERAAGGEVVRYDVPVRMAGDTRVWIDFQVSPLRDTEGRITHLIPSALEIAARHAAEERLQESEQRLRKALTNVSVPTLLHADDGTILLVNQVWTEITGYGIEDIPTTGDWTQKAYGERYVSVKKYIETLFDADTRQDNGEFTVTTATGEQRVWHFSSTPVGREPSGRRLIVSTAIDITERKRVEEQLRQLAADLSEANRKKDEFLATLAHELRNPLAPIRNGLLLMKLAGDDAEAVERSRSMMERQIEQMVRLVDDLMDISRISQGKLELRKEHVPLGAVIASAVETTRPLIEQMGHELTVTLPKQPFIVDADMTRLAQVFMNLLNNSAKYSERGGHIWLTVERQGSDVVVSVRDTGIGIPADNLTSIFDMFSQVDRSLEKSQGGLGIGLSLVKRLVEMHGGRIEAKSDGPGRGSEFVVRLPVDVEASRPQAADKQAEPADLKSSLRILIVDDNQDGADSLAMVLKMMGNDARTAYDGKEGVELAEEFRPEVVLFDIGMPKLNGYEACRLIRKQPWGRKVIVIAVTGWGQDDDRQRSHDAGFDHHMVKPVDPQAVMKMLAVLQVAKA